MRPADELGLGLELELEPEPEPLAGGVIDLTLDNTSEDSEAGGFVPDLDAERRQFEYHKGELEAARASINVAAAIEQVLHETKDALWGGIVKLRDMDNEMYGTTNMASIADHVEGIDATILTSFANGSQQDITSATNKLVADWNMMIAADFMTTVTVTAYTMLGYADGFSIGESEGAVAAEFADYPEQPSMLEADSGGSGREEAAGGSRRSDVAMADVPPAPPTLSNEARDVELRYIHNLPADTDVSRLR
jgi:hypothetical protein